MSSPAKHAVALHVTCALHSLPCQVLCAASVSAWRANPACSVLLASITVSLEIAWFLQALLKHSHGKQFSNSSFILKVKPILLLLQTAICRMLLTHPFATLAPLCYQPCNLPVTTLDCLLEQCVYFLPSPFPEALPRGWGGRCGSAQLRHAARGLGGLNGRSRQRTEIGQLFAYIFPLLFWFRNAG